MPEILFLTRCLSAEYLLCRNRYINNEIIQGFCFLDPFLNLIGEKIGPRSVKEEDCSCGIVAILESRSQKISNQTRSTSASQQTLTTRRNNIPVSLGVLGVSILLMLKFQILCSDCSEPNFLLTSAISFLMAEQPNPYIQYLRSKTQ